MYLIIYLLVMALILVILVFKPELGMQLKAFTERIAFDADWKPSKGTRWRFVFTGVFIELAFLVLLIWFWIYRGR